MDKFRKKPVVIEAFQWTGGHDQTEDPDWAIAALRSGRIYFENPGSHCCRLMIKTLEGTMAANQGDWIIQGVTGELYPCKPDIFEQTYELVEVVRP